jgi:hypothetical protein
LFRKICPTKIAKTTTFDETEMVHRCGISHIHLQRTDSDPERATTDLASDARASPRNFRLAGSKV